MLGRNGLLLLFLGAVFGASFLFMRIAAPVFGPLAVAEGRVLIASLALFAVAREASLRTVLRDWRGYAVLGLTNAALPFALISFAEVHLTASLASLINAATPLATALVATIWLRQRLTGRRSLAIGLGFVGVAVLVGWSPIAATPETLVAVLASVGATFGYAVGLTYSRRRFAGQPPLTVAFGQLVAASVILAPGALLTMPLTAPPAGALAAVVAVGLLCTALAWPILFRLVAALGPTAASTVTFLVPVFGVGWGALFLAEPLAPGMLVGAALVFASVALILDARLPRRAARLVAAATPAP